MKPRAKVLIVDDDPAIINLLTAALQFEGNYLVRNADSGTTALEIIEHFHPDIVLLDIVMSDLDGYEVCRQIKRNSRYKFVKIIMVSGNILLEERLQAYEAGADDYITKPFDLEELRAKVRIFARLKYSEEVDTLKSAWMSLFAHESRTPLNGIHMVAHMLSDQDLGREQQQRYVTLLKHSAARLQKTVEEILAYCRLKGGINISPASGQLRENLRAIVAKHQIESDQSLNFKISCDKSTVIKADWQLLAQALDNVLENAVKFSPASGEIGISGSVEDGLCYINISDQGKGVRPDMAESIFYGFAPDIMHNSESLGISLAASRMIMEHHGGRLYLDKETASGAAFVFRFPA